MFEIYCCWMGYLWELDKLLPWGFLLFLFHCKIWVSLLIWYLICIWYTFEMIYNVLCTFLSFFEIYEFFLVTAKLGAEKWIWRKKEFLKTLYVLGKIWFNTFLVINHLSRLFASLSVGNTNLRNIYWNSELCFFEVFTYGEAIIKFPIIPCSKITRWKWSNHLKRLPIWYPSK